MENKSFKPEDLQDTSRFKLLKVLRYDEIVEFVFENIKKTNSATRMYFLLNLVAVGILIGLSFAGFKHELFTFKKYISSFFLGLVAGSIFVIPLHEILHGLAYKVKGAPKISFGADLKQAIFYVAADKFVVGKNAFFFVALAPFVSINLMSLVLINFSAPNQIISLLFFLLFHNLMCIGDFAMLSFFLDKKGKDLYTYDDHKEKTSYIYESKAASETQEG